MIKEYEDCIRRINMKTISRKYAFDMGVDYAKNGANQTNCDFRLFATQELTYEWERGKEHDQAQD